MCVNVQNILSNSLPSNLELFIATGLGICFHYYLGEKNDISAKRKTRKQRKSKLLQQHHQKVAEHHEQPPKHHKEAARHRESGDYCRTLLIQLIDIRSKLQNKKRKPARNTLTRRVFKSNQDRNRTKFVDKQRP